MYMYIYCIGNKSLLMSSALPLELSFSEPKCWHRTIFGTTFKAHGSPMFIAPFDPCDTSDVRCIVRDRSAQGVLYQVNGAPVLSIGSTVLRWSEGCQGQPQRGNIIVKKRDIYSHLALFSHLKFFIQHTRGWSKDHPRSSAMFKDQTPGLRRCLPRSDQNFFRGRQEILNFSTISTPFWFFFWLGWTAFWPGKPQKWPKSP